MGLLHLGQGLREAARADDVEDFSWRVEARLFQSGLAARDDDLAPLSRP
jgi:hypothetical protein